jgi:hypothetical protein
MFRRNKGKAEKESGKTKGGGLQKRLAKGREGKN